ncbi:ABC transporter substrate-binding protein [Herbiconiux sp. KACC 21604]|uniref:ABC transporter substrate-binding protein n=1 Tax=unclassified Herbiconiux TaxID=2618217 RepID=UPI0014915FC4|nr:ABC transporter substrate-binding protein [Herbiconiux sp. SALV-R1]QJU55678.1 ABC transporter substrate-binding protein [Herbiconiux sp. SALV-R1]WPO86881.1 ABC transporter substrate-binding protein [Herbiconiux sp. KACC 21604]
MIRRKLLGTIGAGVVAALALAGCASDGGGSTAAPDALTVVSYGGAYQEAQSEAFFKPFAADTGITVTEDSPTDYAQLRTMVENGRPTWDLALVANDFGTAADADYLEPIDYSKIDKSALVEGAAQEYRVAADIEASVIAYRSDAFSTQPTTWADLFDTEKFPGKRIFNKLSSGGVLEAALLADGVAPDELYPLDVDRALKKLDTIKDDIIWWDTAAQSQQLLESGEGAIGLVWVGRAVDASKQTPITINWDTWLQVDAYWVIPKGAPGASAAQDLLAAALQTGPQLAFAELSDYGPVNAEAAKDPAVTANENRPTNHLDTRVSVDDDWWGANAEDVDKKFQAWLVS